MPNATLREYLLDQLHKLLSIADEGTIDWVLSDHFKTLKFHNDLVGCAKSYAMFRKQGDPKVLGVLHNLNLNYKEPQYKWFSKAPEDPSWLCSLIPSPYFEGVAHYLDLKSCGEDHTCQILRLFEGRTINLESSINFPLFQWNKADSSGDMKYPYLAENIIRLDLSTCPNLSGSALTYILQNLRKFYPKLQTLILPDSIHKIEGFDQLKLTKVQAEKLWSAAYSSLRHNVLEQVYNLDRRSRLAPQPDRQPESFLESNDAL